MADTNKNVNILINAKDKSKSAFGSLTKSIVGVAAALAAVKVATDILIDITKVGAESEKQWLAVEGALRRHNIEVESGTVQIRKFADEMQTLTGVSDEVVAKGIRRFIDFGASIEQASEQMRVATDLSVGAGLSLDSAVDLLSKAQVGYTSTLSRYGIIIDESIPKTEKFAAAIAQITEKFGGAAADVADSFAVRMAVLSERFGDLKEDIFRLLQPALEAVLESFIALVQTAKDVIAAFQSLSDFLTGTEKELDDTAEATASWTKQIDDLIAALNDGVISIEDFKIALANIGLPKISRADLMELELGLTAVADATGQWVEALVKVPTRATPALEALEQQKRTALLAAEALEKLRRENERLSAQFGKVSLGAFPDEEDLALQKELTNKFFAEFKARQEKISSLFSETRDIRLNAMSAFNESVLLLEEQLQERLKLLDEVAFQDEELNNQLRLEIQQSYYDQLAELQEERLQQLTDEWLEKWRFVQDQVTTIFQNMSVALVTNLNTVGKVMKRTFEEIGRTIVRHLAGLAVDAIFKFIAATVTANAAMAIEKAVVGQLTNAYISLAAAKSAANPLSAPGRLAAAAAVKGGLDAMLGGEGLAGAVGGGFGLPPIGIPFGGGEESPVGGGRAPALTVNINGPILATDEFVDNDLIPKIENAVLNGLSRLMIDNQNVNGESAVGFA